MTPFRIAQLDEIEPADCPCGQTRRAFLDDPDRIASMHLIETTGEARSHYHKHLAELYLILDGTGHLELDGRLVPVKPLSAVLIKPLCRHRVVGSLRFVNIPNPAFDPDDMWFD